MALHANIATLPCSHQTAVGGTGMDGVLGYSKQLGEEGKERTLLGGMIQGSGRSPLPNEQAAITPPEKRARACLVVLQVWPVFLGWVCHLLHRVVQ